MWANKHTDTQTNQQICSSIITILLSLFPYQLKVKVKIATLLVQAGPHLPWVLSQSVDKPLKSVTNGRCNARPTVTFPAVGHHCSTTGTELYCLMREARVCEQLANRLLPLKVEGPGVEPASLVHRPNNYTTRTQPLLLPTEKLVTNKCLYG